MLYFLATDTCTTLTANAKSLTFNLNPRIISANAVFSFRKTMDSIIEQLNANLKIVYRQALDADKKLDELQQQGHGKFKALFAADAGFSFEAKRFKPYVLDVAADVESLSSEGLDEEKLKKAVIKLQNLLTLLATFK
jgi:hypothetical protein